MSFAHGLQPEFGFPNGLYSLFSPSYRFSNRYTNCLIFAINSSNQAIVLTIFHKTLQKYASGEIDYSAMLYSMFIEVYVCRRLF